MADLPAAEPTAANSAGNFAAGSSCLHKDSAWVAWALVVCSYSDRDSLVVYRPVFEQNESEGTNIPQMDFNALNEDVRALREEISERFDRLEKSIVKPVANKSKKAEVSADE